VAKATILVIEDDPDIRELVSYNLGKEGYTVVGAETGERGLTLLGTVNPDLILLDIMLPGTDGLEVLRTLKRSASTERIPVIMTTAKSEDSDIVSGLELGADDYVTKPFSPKVLIARVRAVLRRVAEKAGPKTAATEPVSIGGIRIDSVRHEVACDGALVDLSATEFAILDHLMRNPGWVFSRNQIIDAVKGKDYPVTERSVDVQILGLRKKLGGHGERIQTVRGVGYRFLDAEGDEGKA
jgi:two-component system phosphate regulon response regulator PhoB